MSASQKNKGKSGEREFCQKLKDIFGGNWMRVPNSGAFVGGSNSHRKLLMDNHQIILSKGDIIPAEHMKKFVAECKFYKDFPFHQLFSKECKQLDIWIEQTLDCVDEGDVWFLLIKINRKGHYVCCHESLGLFSTHYTRYKDFVFCDFESFFAENSDKILEMCRDINNAR